MRPPFVLSGLLALILAGHALTAGAKDAPAPAAPATAPAPSPTCDIVALRLEDVIAKSAELQRSANAQTVRDLRTLRDAAVVLDAYKHPEVCAQVLAVLRGLAANPERAIDQSGDTDEEKAEAVEKARTPKAPEKSPEKAPEIKAK
ncbi:photosystem reaction center subunit H [Methylobacterium currus]|uniref:photosystem reaction center subunit H n=1 Tax=Methylobacterium currus TaxID=2051553 RepID=UPI000C68FA3C|nr:photosystem reaction center subunit H [Methylobacterium currus]UHC14152.1 photosystem reaction center subunit H [Methylobacterium currus]